MKKHMQQEFTALSDFGEYVSDPRFQSIFLVVDRAACEAAGLFPKLVPLLNGRRVVEFDQFIENPRLEHILLGVDAFRRADPDLVIAIGTRLSDFATGSQSCFNHTKVKFIGINVTGHDAYKNGALPILADAREALSALHQASQKAGLKPNQHRVAGLLRRLGIEDLRGGQVTTGPQRKIQPTD